MAVWWNWSPTVSGFECSNSLPFLLQLDGGLFRKAMGGSIGCKDRVPALEKLQQMYQSAIADLSGGISLFQSLRENPLHCRAATEVCENFTAGERTS